MFFPPCTGRRRASPFSFTLVWKWDTVCNATAAVFMAWKVATQQLAETMNMHERHSVQTQYCMSDYGTERLHRNITPVNRFRGKKPSSSSSSGYFCLLICQMCLVSLRLMKIWRLVGNWLELCRQWERNISAERNTIKVSYFSAGNRWQLIKAQLIYYITLVLSSCGSCNFLLGSSGRKLKWTWNRTEIKMDKNWAKSRL